jgi:hypothetical protein
MRGREEEGGTDVNENNIRHDGRQEERFGGATIGGCGISAQGGVGDVIQRLEARESSGDEESVPGHIHRLDRARFHLPERQQQP